MICCLSHPVWVRGLKPVLIHRLAGAIGSHPVWVRGLKPLFQPSTKEDIIVAPRVGAWIETNRKAWAAEKDLSHPVWVRGLKRQRHARTARLRDRRTPCGCVD